MPSNSSPKLTDHMPQPSLFDEMTEVIKRWVGRFDPEIERCEICSKNYPALQAMPWMIDCCDLLAELYACVERNCDHSRLQCPTDNWCWKPALNIEPDRNLKEQLLKQRIVQLRNPQWINDIPTAVGLCGQDSDKSRIIDFVRKSDEDSDSYELIVFKWKNRAPLYSALEILRHGIVYLFTRMNRTASPIPELLRAKTVGLRVLAPDKYYRQFDKENLDWLERYIHYGIQEFAASRDCGVGMGFEFLQFPYEFSQSTDPATVRAVLRCISRERSDPFRL